MDFKFQVVSRSSPGPLDQQSPTVWAPGTGFVEYSFSHGWGGDDFRMTDPLYVYYATPDLTGGRALAVMQAWGVAVNTDEASFTGPPLTSCCVSRFLTGHRPVLTQGLGTPGLDEPHQVCFLEEII